MQKHDAQRFEAWRSGGNRSTNVQLSTNAK